MGKIHSYDESVVSFHAIDNHMRTANPSDFGTFESMKDYICRAIPANKYRELYLARAIVVCMGHEWYIPDSTPENVDSPIGILKIIQLQHASYFEGFAVLGSELGLEVEIIEGRCRALPYEAGDDDSPAIQNGAWNAVKLAGNWHLLCPDWILTGVVGFRAGGVRLLETDGEKSGELQTSCSGLLESVFDDFWFLINPEIAKFCVLPDDDTWQLLPDSKKIRSVTEFLELPFAKSKYFEMGLSIISQQSCKIRSNNGTCTVSLLAGKTISKKLVLTYSLEMKESEESEALSTTHLLDLPLLVLNSRNGDVFTFEIRFPVEGTFMFHISGEIFDTGDQHEYCSFLILCDERKANFQKLPVDASVTGGWGHGPQAEEVGLRQLPNAASNAKLKVTKLGVTDVVGCKTKKPETGIIAYHVDDDAMKENVYETVIYGSDSIDEDRVDLQGNVHTAIDEVRGRLVVHATVPRDGEYALVLHVGGRHGNAKPDMRAVCTYLLNTETSTDDEIYEKMLKKKKMEVVKQQKRNQREERKSKLEDEIEALRQELTALGEDDADKY